ncbi:flavodoxin [Lachnospiraceae bacterium]|nr:flavodoxin [Lachnospiraceae bacterium]
MRKRIFSLFLAGALATGLLAGCSSNSGEQESAPVIQSGQAIGETEPEEETDTSEEADTGNADMEENESNEAGGKTIVVYFSATGNTERVAGMIAEAAGGELSALEPVESYTDADLDWTDENSRVGKEHDDPEQRKIELVSTEIKGWEDASVVYVGYPVWWGIAAWPVNSFVEANDFTEKTVIPFCTSVSSGLGESGELLAELAGSGAWKEGMRFPSNVSDEEVWGWVEGLGL